MKSLKKFIQKHRLFLTIFLIAIVVNIPWFLISLLEADIGDQFPIFIFVFLPYYPILWIVQHTPFGGLSDVTSFIRGIFIVTPLFWSAIIFGIVKLFQSIKKKLHAR
ncbi:MAG: hypothetical protein WC730_00445 [Patescibacteria group bacterium]|jgi:hypothetical protein